MKFLISKQNDDIHENEKDICIYIKQKSNNDKTKKTEHIHRAQHINKQPKQLIG